MVAVNSCWEVRDQIMADKPSVLRRMTDATNGVATLNILTGQRNTANAVRERIFLMRRILNNT
jgi:hypothetical protein